MSPLHPRLVEVTARIEARSASSRSAYLAVLQAASGKGGAQRSGLGCANAAHAYAAMPAADKLMLRQERAPHLGLITAYNDMLSAHQPYEHYPESIRASARRAGATAQVAGGVPAMCDGITQGEDGMELSLFSRDVIALSSVVGLSHNVFDAALFLGVCDKIVPGLLMGALQFGHLPALFIPAGPMTSGLANEDKAKVRQQFAQGLVDRQALLDAEQAAYHGPGTCTFYGTANSNQMLMEVMGLHLPGAAFVNPGTELRSAMTRAAAQHAASITALGGDWRPIGEIVDERAIVNAIVGLHATGGSTNHTIHLVAIARAAGILIDWDDFDSLARVTPMLARVYPNGQADVNDFHAAGGLAFIIRDLLEAGLLHRDVRTVAGCDLTAYARQPALIDGVLDWRDPPAESLDHAVVRRASAPFAADGGMRLVSGNLGRAIVKISAVKPEHHAITAPAVVFSSQAEFLSRFQAGELDRDMVAVLRFQGPRANGMPELHKLTPSLGVLQDRGFKVALLTDGRMSGASGKVLAAIHVSPEALCGGPISQLRDGDMVRIDASAGVMAAEARTVLEARSPAVFDPASDQIGVGRELFAGFRALVGSAEEGALAIPDLAQASLAHHAGLMHTP